MRTSSNVAVAAIMQEELTPIRERRKEFEKDIPAIYDMFRKGCETAELNARKLLFIKQEVKMEWALTDSNRRPSACKGCETARATATATLDEVRKAMKINYFDDVELIAEQAKRFGQE